MQSVFLKILSIGMNASWMILAILCLRIVFWKSPKWIACFYVVFGRNKALMPL